MSTITAPMRGVRLPLLLFVLAFVAAAIISGVVTYALTGASDSDSDTPVQASTSEVPALQQLHHDRRYQNDYVAQQIERSQPGAASAAPVQPDEPNAVGSGPGRPVKDAEVVS